MPRGLFGGRVKPFQRQSAVRSGARSIHRDFTHQGSLDSSVVAGPDYLDKWVSVLGVEAAVGATAKLSCNKQLVASSPAVSTGQLFCCLLLAAAAAV